MLEVFYQFNILINLAFFIYIFTIEGVSYYNT